MRHNDSRPADAAAGPQALGETMRELLAATPLALFIAALREGRKASNRSSRTSDEYRAV